ncbi:MAG: DUF4350 domain-containing protein [Sulfuricella sp.]
MTRRAMFWWALGALAVAVLGTAWFLTEFSRVPTTRWERMGPEARKNNYLALQRFLVRMGRPVRVVSDARQLEKLPPGGVLILDRERRRNLPPERAEALLRWVANGGYLIVAAENAGTEDAILRRLDVSWYQPPRKAAEEDEPLPHKPAPRPKTVQLSIPGVELLALDRVGAGLVVGKRQPAWQAEQETGRAQVLHYAWGAGQVTVFNCFCAFINRNIGQYDHADIVWSLLSTYQPRGPVWLAARLKVPSLWEWLAEAAWMPLASGALLMLLWLWRIVPRFGGMRRLPVPERRGLADHLAAVGRGVWREGGLPHWLQLVRQTLLGNIAKRHPHVLQLPAAERAAALARLSGMSTARVRQALEGRGSESPRAFTDTVRAIQQLQQRL